MSALAITSERGATVGASAPAVSSLQARMADHVMNAFVALVPNASTADWEHALDCAFSAVPNNGEAA